MIVHICPADKFIPAFVEFVRENYDSAEHKFYVQLDADNRDRLSAAPDLVLLDSVTATLDMMGAMEKAQKIILHSLWVYDANRILLENQDWLQRCYWNMWGGDFYNPESQSSGTHTLIRKMGFCLTDVDGDYELAREWYGTSAVHLRCLGYPSNMFSGDLVERDNSDCFRILLGNSANPSNNHLAMLPRLAQFINQPARIFAPLSYGNKSYASQVCEWGQTLLADQFEPMLDALPLEQYKRFMRSIDIAIFNHDRQQALGNIIPLAGMGKKIYLQKNTPHARRLIEQGIQIFDVSEVNADPLPAEAARTNHERVSVHYSKERMTREWSNIFSYSL